MAPTSGCRPQVRPGAAGTVAASGIPPAHRSRSGRRDPRKGTAGSTATSLDSCRPPGEYSTKIPQRGWTGADLRACCGTVTCGDGLWWMACLLMAFKRSGVHGAWCQSAATAIEPTAPSTQPAAVTAFSGLMLKADSAGRSGGAVLKGHRRTMDGENGAPGSVCAGHRMVAGGVRDHQRLG